MISRDAGLALRAAPPSRRCRLPTRRWCCGCTIGLERDELLDGQLAGDSAPPSGRCIFSLEDAAAVSVSITALSGEVDVYVAADMTPSPAPWKSATGSDLVAIAAGQPGFVPTGTYSITVVNPTPRTTDGGDKPGGGSSGAASFVLVAATASRPIKLQAGVPTFQMASAGHPRLFRFWPPADGSDTLAITLTPLCPPGGFCLPGDADLCVSRNATALAAAAKYLTRATASVCEWSSTEGGASNDLVTINPKEAAAGGPYFIAVDAASETPVYYNLVAQASVFDAALLVPGRPQRGTVGSGGAWRYYRLRLTADASNITLVLTKTAGVPGLYVGLGGRPPTRSSYLKVAQAGALTLSGMEVGVPTTLEVGSFRGRKRGTRCWPSSRPRPPPPPPPRTARATPTRTACMIKPSATRRLRRRLRRPAAVSAARCACPPPAHPPVA